MSKAEAAICARIKMFREHTKSPQAVLATMLGITQQKYISIEHGRTPLRWAEAQRLSRELNLSQAWLAEGIGIPHPHIVFDAAIENAIPPRLLFSEAYRLYLRPKIGDDGMRILKLAEHTEVRTSFIAPVGLTGHHKWAWYLSEEIRVAFDGIKVELLPDLAQAVLGAMDDFCKDHGIKRKMAGHIRPKDWPRNRPVPWEGPKPTSSQGLPLGADEPSNLKKDGLTDAETASSVAAVKAQLPGLLERLKRATAETGKKSELAEFLKAPLASVSRWLSGEREPGGEVALQMLYWVEQQERKK